MQFWFRIMMHLARDNFAFCTWMHKFLCIDNYFDPSRRLLSLQSVSVPVGQPQAGPRTVSAGRAAAVRASDNALSYMVQTIEKMQFHLFAVWASWITISNLFFGCIKLFIDLHFAAQTCEASESSSLEGWHWFFFIAWSDASVFE